MIQCQMCNFKTYRQSNLDYHIMTHHSEEYTKSTCGVCGKRFPSAFNAQLHVEQVHMKIKRYGFTMSIESSSLKWRALLNKCPWEHIDFRGALSWTTVTFQISTFAIMVLLISDTNVTFAQRPSSIFLSGSSTFKRYMARADPCQKMPNCACVQSVGPS